jgi:Kef-type K+ transport system membrane component KefB
MLNNGKLRDVFLFEQCVDFFPRIGITWGYTIAILVAAFIGKFGGCTLAARYAAHFNWRESATIGSLMSCKG